MAQVPIREARNGRPIVRLEHTDTQADRRRKEREAAVAKKKATRRKETSNVRKSNLEVNANEPVIGSTIGRARTRRADEMNSSTRNSNFADDRKYNNNNYNSNHSRNYNDDHNSNSNSNSNGSMTMNSNMSNSTNEKRVLTWQERNDNLRWYHAETIIVERSALDVMLIFAQHLGRHGLLHPWEYSLLLRSFFTIDWQPGLHIYLQCDPRESYARLRRRNRAGEQPITQEIITSLHDLHEDVYGRSDVRSIPVGNIVTECRPIGKCDARLTTEDLVKEVIEYIDAYMHPDSRDTPPPPSRQ